MTVLLGATATDYLSDVHSVELGCNAGYSSANLTILPCEVSPYCRRVGNYFALPEPPLLLPLNNNTTTRHAREARTRVMLDRPLVPAAVSRG